MCFHVEVTNENGEGSTEITFGTGSITGMKSHESHVCLQRFAVCPHGFAGNHGLFQEISTRIDSASLTHFAPRWEKSDKI